MPIPNPSESEARKKWEYHCGAEALTIPSVEAIRRERAAQALFQAVSAEIQFTLNDYFASADQPPAAVANDSSSLI